MRAFVRRGISIKLIGSLAKANKVHGFEGVVGSAAAGRRARLAGDEARRFVGGLCITCALGDQLASKVAIRISPVRTL